MATKLIHKELSYTVYGILLQVRNELGPMLPEAFYRDATKIALTKANIRCEVEKSFTVFYQGTQVGLYAVDLWVEDGKIVLELKVAPAILPLHKAQAISYLKVTDADLAIIANFGTPSFVTERLPNFVRDKQVAFVWTPRELDRDLLYPELTEPLFKLLHRVHFELGPGFLHQIYRRATMVALQTEKIFYNYLQQIPVLFQGHHIGNQETHMLRVEEKILLAPIAVLEITEAMEARLRALLIQQGLQLGLIANFHGVVLEIKAVRAPATQAKTTTNWGKNEGRHRQVVHKPGQCQSTTQSTPPPIRCSFTYRRMLTCDLVIYSAASVFS
jgi:GxxExxY protein